MQYPLCSAKAVRDHFDTRRAAGQVFVNGRLVGGAQETIALLQSGELQQLISSAHGAALPPELQNAADAAAAAYQVGLVLMQ